MCGQNAAPAPRRGWASGADEATAPSRRLWRCVCGTRLAVHAHLQQARRIMEVVGAAPRPSDLPEERSWTMNSRIGDIKMRCGDPVNRAMWPRIATAEWMRQELKTLESSGVKECLRRLVFFLCVCAFNICDAIVRGKCASPTFWWGEMLSLRATGPHLRGTVRRASVQPPGTASNRRSAGRATRRLIGRLPRDW